jgi:hypothetical protein
MPPLFSYEIVRLLRRFAKGPRDKIDLPILAQAADEIEGLRAYADRARRLTRARQRRNRRMRPERATT